jgi:hypothetical protein
VATAVQHGRAVEDRRLAGAAAEYATWLYRRWRLVAVLLPLGVTELLLIPFVSGLWPPLFGGTYCSLFGGIWALLAYRARRAIKLNRSLVQPPEPNTRS